MNKKIKTIVVTLIILLVSVGITGCGNDSASKEKELIIWSRYIGEENRPIKEIAEQWAKETGNTVKVLNSRDELDSISTAVQNGKGPDLIVGINQEELSALAKAKTIEKIPEGKIDRTKYLSQAVNAGTYNGSLWAQPTTIEPYAVLYNKDMVKNIPNSWDELFNTGKEKGLKWDFNNSVIFDIFSNKLKKGDKVLSQLYDRKFVTASDYGDIPMQLFINKKIGILVSGSETVKKCREAKLNIGVVPLPTLEGQTIPIFTTFKFNCICLGSKKNDLIWNFMEYSYKKLPEALFKAEGTVPAVTELANSNEVNSDLQFSQFVQVSKIDVSAAK